MSHDLVLTGGHRKPIPLTLYSFMFDKIMPLTEAAEGYDLFDKMKVQQVIFKP